MRQVLFIMLLIVPFIANGQDKANYKDTFMVVELMPKYPGGNEKLDQYVYDNLRLPKQAIENKVNTILYMNFVVDPDGKISNVRIARGKAGYGCEEEALRVFNLMASVITWIPGRQRNVRVPVFYSYPLIINYKKFDKKTLVHKKAEKGN